MKAQELSLLVSFKPSFLTTPPLLARIRVVSAPVEVSSQGTSSSLLFLWDLFFTTGGPELIACVLPFCAEQKSLSRPVPLPFHLDPNSPLMDGQEFPPGRPAHYF